MKYAQPQIKVPYGIETLALVSGLLPGMFTGP